LIIHIPEKENREIIHHIIYEELTRGIFKEDSRSKLVKIVNDLEGISGVILGCTELPLVIKPSDTDLVLFNTTEIHVKAAIDFVIN